MTRTLSMIALALAFMVVVDDGLRAQTPTPTPPARRFGLPAAAPTPAPTPSPYTGPSTRIMPAGTEPPNFNSMPWFKSAAPGSVKQGQQSVAITLTGENTHFQQNVTSADFGGGITVTSLTVTSPTTAVALVNVAANAAVGAHNIRVTTAGEQADMALTAKTFGAADVSGFTVNALLTTSNIVMNPAITKNSMTGTAASSGSNSTGSSSSSGGTSAGSTGNLPSLRDALPGIFTKEGYASVVGSRQGQLGSGSIRVVKFDFYPAKPTDAAGKIQAAYPANFRTVTITKRLDASSIPLLEALARNEPLNSVTLALMESPPNNVGQGVAAAAPPKAVIVLRLTGSQVASVHQYFDSTGALEDITFTFSQIDIQNPTNNGDFTWSNANVSK